MSFKDKCDKGRIPAAGIFPLSETSGVFVSTVEASSEKVRLFLHEKYGDDFRVVKDEVHTSHGKVQDGYIFLVWFEVVQK